MQSPLKFFKPGFKIIFILILLNISSLLSAANYYVSSSSGNNRSNGRSQSTAWQNISKVNGKTFLPGDSVFFRRGDIWRETLAVAGSGTPNSNIYFGTYGTGANPKILGSESVGKWTDQGGNIWKSDNAFTDPRTNNADIHFIEQGVVKWGNYKPAAASLKSKYDWTWNNNCIYIFSESNPASAFSSVEVPQLYCCIDTYHNEYIHFNGIDVMYAAYIGYDDNSSHSDHADISGLIIENCEIAFIGGITRIQSGFGVAVVYSDMVIRNCTIHDCGRRGVSLDIYGSGFTASNAIIENNNFYGGFHTTGVDLSVGSGTYTGSWDGVYIRNNTFSDIASTPYIYGSNQIFLQNHAWSSQKAKAGNIYIYNNIFKYPNLSAINVEGMSKVFIYNNVFYETSKTSSYVVQLWIDANNTNLKIKNNIFYSSSTDKNFGFAIYCVTPGTEIDLDYNLYSRVNNSVYVIRYYGTDYFMNTIATSLRSKYAWETHCPAPAADPLFVSKTDYRLKAGSPAISKGIQVKINNKILDKDFGGKNYMNPPSIGAYEYK
jgi:hypothetical protein